MVCKAVDTHCGDMLLIFIYMSVLMLSTRIYCLIEAFYTVCLDSDDTSILFCSGLEPSPYYHSLL